MRVLVMLLIICASLGSMDFAIAQSPAQKCSCSASLPAEGIYTWRVGFAQISTTDSHRNARVEVKVQPVNGGGCGSRVVWTGVSEPAMDYQIHFDCVEGIFQGELGGRAIYFVANDASPHFSWAELSTDFVGEISKKDGRFTLTIEDKAKAEVPECLCARVREEYDSDVDWKEQYAHQPTIKRALRLGLPGKTVGAKYWLNEDGHLVEFQNGDNRPAEAYDDTVGNVDDDGNILVQNTESASVENAKSRDRSALPGDAAAGLRASTCEIIPPDREKAAELCTPEVVLQSSIRHEMEHKRRCEAINKRFPKYGLIEESGTTWVDYEAEVSAFGYYEERILPMNAYST